MNLNKLFHYAFIAFLAISTCFFLPIQVGTPNPVDAQLMFQELFFRYGVILLFGLSLLIPSVRKMDFKVLGSFLIYLILVSIPFGYPLEIRRAILNVFFGILMMKLVVDYFEFKWIRTLGFVLSIVLIHNLLLSIGQINGIDPIYTSTSPELGIKEPTGLVLMKAHLGTLSVLSMPFVMAFNWPIALIVCGALVALSKSSAAVVAYVFIVSYFALKRFGILKGLIPVLVFFGLLGGSYVYFYDMPSGDFMYRFKIWLEVINKFKITPFFGVGVGQYAKIAIKQVQSPDNPQLLEWAQLHNEFLQHVIETGIAGACFLWAFLKKLLREMNPYSFSAIISLAIISFLHFPFHLGRFAPLACFIIGFQILTLTKVEK